jgi:hypothetical protein
MYEHNFIHKVRHEETRWFLSRVAAPQNLTELYFLILKMVSVCFSETLVTFCENKKHRIAEASNFNYYPTAFNNFFFRSQVSAITRTLNNPIDGNLV